MSTRSARWRVRSSLADATIALTAATPFTSAITTGTPIRENPSAMSISDTVFPVPVAPAVRPWRLPYLARRYTGSSPWPRRMSSWCGAIPLLKAAAHGSDAVRVEAKPVHSSDVAGVLYFDATIHDDRHTTRFRDARALLVDDRELIPEVSGAYLGRLAGDRG